MTGECVGVKYFAYQTKIFCVENNGVKCMEKYEICIIRGTKVYR